VRRSLLRPGDGGGDWRGGVVPGIGWACSGKRPSRLKPWFSRESVCCTVFFIYFLLSSRVSLRNFQVREERHRHGHAVEEDGHHWQLRVVRLRVRSRCPVAVVRWAHGARSRGRASRASTLNSTHKGVASSEVRLHRAGTQPTRRGYAYKKPSWACCRDIAHRDW